MGYRIDYEEMDVFLAELKKNTDSYMSGLDEIKQASEAFIDMGSFEGQAAVRMKTYQSDVGMLVIRSMKLLCQELVSRVSAYVSDYKETVDPAGDTRIDCDEQREALTGFANKHVASTEIAPWLRGYNLPSGTGGRSTPPIDVAKYGFNYSDWYSYEGLSGLYPTILAEYPELREAVMIGNNGELIEPQSGRQWVSVGPAINSAQYPDNGELRADDPLLSFGKKIDAVLKHPETGEIVYLYLIIGGVKAHTFIAEGNPDNGKSHTGVPYPNNSDQGVFPSDGSSIEFMGQHVDNGSLSEYTLVDMLVYDKE